MRFNPKTGKEAKIILTIAHLNHEPEDCRPENLRALCQRCHNQYDAKHRVETRKIITKNILQPKIDFDDGINPQD